MYTQPVSGLPTVVKPLHPIVHDCHDFGVIVLTNGIIYHKSVVLVTDTSLTWPLLSKESSKIPSPVQISALPNARPSDPGVDVNHIALWRGEREREGARGEKGREGGDGVRGERRTHGTSHQAICPSLESASHSQTDVHHPVLGRKAGLCPDPATAALNGGANPHLVITGDTT